MLDGTIPHDSHGQYLNIVRDESKRLSKLIGELLALSRLERDDAALNVTDFDICDLLERVFLRRIGDLEAKQLDVDCDFNPEPCYVRADMARIEQVAVNLIDNAIKFTPENGCITLQVRLENSLCTVTVADNGPGILPEDRPHVFERFFTADRAHTSGKGTGLGLSICQRIMEMHGQQIRLLDTPEGAAFAFTLPLGKRSSERLSVHESGIVDNQN
ncbi:MAG: HAMP domain-containing histidine kinase [Clostridia bacterium]|nr:HAMP domain-containing histidine kinase [Clostridia bacterium]